MVEISRTVLAEKGISTKHCGTDLTAFIEITRPFTLLPPFLGILSGSFAALGSMAASGEIGFTEGISLYWQYMLAGGIVAALLNAASNILNQITELELDKCNKPHRVLPCGRMRKSSALMYAIILYLFSLSLAWWITPIAGMRHTFWCVTIAALATVFYSTKPFYTKSRGWWANITIAIPRGCLLKVAGWGCVASVLAVEPWFIGLVFMLFLLGAASSKDFSDLEGDRKGGVRTLVVIYGEEKTARIIAPFFILPWFMLISGMLLPLLFNFAPVLHSAALPTILLGVILAAYGVFIARLMNRASAASIEGNHPAWKHMYLMMMAGQLGLVVCYLL